LYIRWPLQMKPSIQRLAADTGLAPRTERAVDHRRILLLAEFYLILTLPEADGHEGPQWVIPSHSVPEAKGPFTRQGKALSFQKPMKPRIVAIRTRW
jgi:hypothetical protein